MFGFLIFNNICLNLSMDHCNRLLGKIFGVNDVSVSSVRISEKRIIFKLFSDGVFYQYVIAVGGGEDSIYNDGKIVDCVIFTEGNNFLGFNDFICRLFQCKEEYRVYQLVRELL